jgi:alkanesulfonate monooxygenase SsuD/methylene tetrahydromethanopterin reductase-like flavin-dependent oxidoreductase (luciferase family)
MADAGYWFVGTPDDCIEGIKQLDEKSGGYGGFLVDRRLGTAGQDAP